jgi:hypothetical protein
MLSLCKSVQWFSPLCRPCEDEGRGPSERSIRAGKLKAVQSEKCRSLCIPMVPMAIGVGSAMNFTTIEN